MKKLYTINDLKRAYIEGGRNGSNSGLKLAYTGRLSTISFEEWFDKKYGLMKNKKLNKK